MSGTPWQAAASAEPLGTGMVLLVVLLAILLSAVAILLLRMAEQPIDPELPARPEEPPEPLPADPPPADPPPAWLAHRPADRGRATPSEPLPAWLAQAGAAEQMEQWRAVRAVLDDLVDAGNRGDLEAGFSLYTPELARRTRSELELGLPANSAANVNEPRLTIAVVVDPLWVAPGRLAVTVRYKRGEETPPAERIVLVKPDRSGRWLVDAIARDGE